MDIRIVKVKRRLGDGTYERKFAKTDTFCPYCGKQDVYEHTGEGDYYVGHENVCLSCDSAFTWQSSKKDAEAIKQLKAH